MRALIPTTSFRILAAGIAAAVVATTPLPAIAQDNSEARLRKIEAEIRALQRNVFPGGDGRFFEPQIAPNSSTNTGPATSNSTTAVTDILARLDAMELQLQQLTARTEENSNALSLMETRLAALEAPQGGSIPLGPSISTGTGASTAPEANLGAMTQGASTGTAGTAQTTTSGGSDAAQSGPSAERLAAVQEIAKPITEDPADDEYSYGFRLWNAGYYPEARQQLSSFLKQYGSHWRATYGRNLLGRAYLDDSQPEEAARWFLNNYQADKQAPRAPDSLLYLSEAMIALNDTNRACIALAEFGEIYPALATGRLSDQYERNRQRVTCN
ncbi:MAG: hypothetical protein AAGL68_08485 [Pseudomonadota bacterium]